MATLRACSMISISVLLIVGCVPSTPVVPSPAAPAITEALTKSASTPDAIAPSTVIPAPPTSYPAATASATLGPLGEVQPISDGYVYLGDPKQVALGFNLHAGGAIGSLLYHGTELIDDADFGRYFQFSPYDANDQYRCDSSSCFATWGWNPLQAGSADGNPARVQEYRRWADGLYVRAPGVEWGKRQGISDVIYETWAWDRDSYFEIHTRMSHTGTDTHGLAGAESPAAYFGAAIPMEYGYTGIVPFTAADIQQYYMVTGDMSQNTNPAIFPSESWMAFGDKQGSGLILAVPPQSKLRGDWSMVFIQNAYPNPIGYLAPFAYLETTPSSVFDLTYYLIPGPVTKGRTVVYDLIPHTTWTFDLNSAEGWTGADGGLKVEHGVLTASVTSTAPLTSMPGLDFDGSHSSGVNVTARTSASTSLCMRFVTLADWNWDPGKSSCAQIQPGKLQQIHLDFSNNMAWMNGVVTRLQLVTQAPAVLDIDEIAVSMEIHGWEFNNPRDADTWVGINQLLRLQSASGTLSSTSTGDDPYMWSPHLGIEAAQFRRIEIRMQTQAGNDAQIFFVSDKDPNWDEAKSQHFATVSDGAFHTYTVDMANVPGWKDVIAQIRLDPMVTLGDLEIDYIRIFR